MSEYIPCPRCGTVTAGTWDGRDHWAVCPQCFGGEIMTREFLLYLNGIAFQGKREVFHRDDTLWEWGDY